MIIFCHLLNDSSGSPRVLASVIKACTDPDKKLFIGQGHDGILGTVDVDTTPYWYHRSNHRIITLFTYFYSQICLYRALSRDPSIAKDATLYVNTLLPFGAALWGWRHRHRVIYHVHEISISPGPLRLFLTWVARKTARQLIYVSHDHQKRLPIADVPFQILPNRVDGALMAQAQNTPYSPRRSGAFNVLMLASPRDFKGIPEFIDLAVACPDMVFTLVLNGAKDEITQYLAQFDLPSNIRTHGRTQDPGQHYAQADVVVNLSRPKAWIETFGLTLIEALAFGIPVIAPPVGGPVEILAPTEAGFLIEGTKTDILKATLQDLASDPDATLHLSDIARAHAQSYAGDAFKSTLSKILDPNSV